jgi:hypothetical protein
MTPIEIIIITLALGGIALLIGLLSVLLPNAKQRRQPRRHHFKEPAPMTFKENVHANDIDNGSSVDKEKALKSFNI